MVAIRRTEPAGREPAASRLSALTSRRTLQESFAALLGVELAERPKPPPPKTETQICGQTIWTYVYPRNYRPHTAARRAHALQDRLEPPALPHGPVANDDCEEAARQAHLRPQPVRFLVMCCGRRGGKTQTGAAQFVANVLADIEDKILGRGLWAGFPHEPWVEAPGKDQEPFLKYFVIAPTHGLNDEPKIALRKYFGHKDDPEPGLIVDQADKPSVWWLKQGVRIDFLSADRPLLNVGRGYNGGWLEEASRIKEDLWENNLRATLSDHRGWAIFTTTPLGRNWFHDQVWSRGDLKAAQLVSKLRGKPLEEIYDPTQFGCVSWTTADNDAIPTLREEMELARRHLSDANWRRNYKADFDAFEGQVFDMGPKVLAPSSWGPGDRWRRIWAGFDPGMTHRASFSVAVQTLLTGTFREVATDSAADVLPYGDDAWRLRGAGDRSTWANRLWAALVEVVGDRWGDVPVFLPADRPDIAQEWERYGFAVDVAFQEHEPAVTWMQTAIKSGVVEITSDVLFTCMTTLRFPGPGESSSKLWIDKNDDEWDSFRYALSEVIRDGFSPLADGAPLAAMGWVARR